MTISTCWIKNNNSTIYLWETNLTISVFIRFARQFSVELKVKFRKHRYYLHTTLWATGLHVWHLNATWYFYMHFCFLKDCHILCLRNLLSENVFGYSAAQGCWEGVNCIIWREDKVSLEACLAKRTRVASNNILVFLQHHGETGCRREKVIFWNIFFSNSKGSEMAEVY